LFEILKFGYCDLFDICVLLFEILLMLKPYVSYNMPSINTR